MKSIVICSLCVVSFLISSCKKKDKDLFLSGQLVDSSNAPITTRSLVLYTLDFGKSFNGKEKYYPFSFATDEMGKFRVMFNMGNDADMIMVFYAGEPYDGNKPLYSSTANDNNIEIDAGVIVVPRK